MGAADPLIAAVVDRIVAHETAWRVGRALPVELPPPPAGTGPVTVLAGGAFGRGVLDRRERFLRAVGWIDGAVDDCRPGQLPGLPPEATVEDHVAALAAARRVHAGSPVEAALAGSLGVAVVGVEVPPLDTSFWRAFFDDVADRTDPAWRDRARTPGGAWPRLEAVTLAADSAFGRRRVLPVWRALGRVVAQLGVAKRRWLR